MNVSELTESDYLNSCDYAVGTKFPPRKITQVTRKKPPSNPKGAERLVIHLEGVPKPWMISSRVVIRTMGAKLGMRDIDKTWIGAEVGIEVVGNVRRPDGTVGNAFRPHLIVEAKGGAE